MFRRCILLILAILTAGISLVPGPAMAGTFPLAQWLDEPDVKLVAVEFYASWCEPCKEAAPRWEALRKAYTAQGLKLVVVNVDAGGQEAKACGVLPWRPDESICDPFLGKRFGVNKLPAAFLWSWQGNLLVDRGHHVDAIEKVIKRYLNDNPRVQVTAVGEHGKPDRALQTRVEAALHRAGKLSVVAGKEMRARLTALGEASHKLSRREEQRCILGAEVSPNSLLNVEQFNGSLSLSLTNAESHCQLASVSVLTTRRASEKAIQKGVYKLITRLKRSQLQMPGATRPTRVIFKRKSSKAKATVGPPRRTLSPSPS